MVELDLKTREIAFIYNSSLQSEVVLEVLEFIVTFINSLKDIILIIFKNLH